jgi:murein DD-endopeptidase MepM/ murein hydrolase activator NlpD
VPEGSDTSSYGVRTHPVQGGRRFHTGLDIGKGRGSPIIAANDGRIIRTSNDTSPYRGFGQIAIQDHGDGLQSIYSHLDSYSVREGELVTKGKEIGKMGSTGMSTGPHLHYILQKAGGFAVPNQSNTVDPKPKLTGRPMQRAEKGGIFTGFDSVFLKECQNHKK